MAPTQVFSEEPGAQTAQTRMPPASHTAKHVTSADGSEGHNDKDAEKDGPEPEGAPAADPEVREVAFKGGGAQTEAEGVENARCVPG